MSLAVIASKALSGSSALPVYVEVHISSGLPSFSIVGLPNAGVRESRERVRSAIINSGFNFPAGRVTVNLAPADLPKESGRFDLPIAIGILIASGQINVLGLSGQSKIENYIIAGELSLTGAIMPVYGALLIALATAENDITKNLILPKQDARLAANVDNIHVLEASTLLEVVKHFNGNQNLNKARATQLNSGLASVPKSSLCLSDVYGQELACRAIKIAASGGHSLLLSGTPGSGKSMLAQRLPTLLPPLTKHQALQVAAIHNLKTGRLAYFSDNAPLRVPHHSISKAALVGGGSKIAPGEITLANNGVLFLDELPHFKLEVLEALREPLETGTITISRVSGTVVYDASFQLIAAMNPCPCGWLGHNIKNCACTNEAIAKYKNKISGPLLDRIDLQVNVAANNGNWFNEKPNQKSSVIRPQIIEICQLQLARQKCLNSKLQVHQLSQYCKLDDNSKEQLDIAMSKWGWSSRVIHKTIRIARTIADIQGLIDIKYENICEAISYRQT